MPRVRRIVVGVHGSLGSLQALRHATAEARQRNVPLLTVIAWLPPGGDLAERRHPSPDLRRIWRNAAWERLLEAFDAGLGGVPADIGVEPEVMRTRDYENRAWVLLGTQQGAHASRKGRCHQGELGLY